MILLHLFPIQHTECATQATTLLYGGEDTVTTLDDISKIRLAMGQVKEPDAALTYLENHIRVHYPGWTLHEAGACVLAKVPQSIMALNDKLDMTRLPTILASCDGYVRNAAGALQHVAEFKVRIPFQAKPKSDTFVYTGKHCQPMSDVHLEHFCQCQFQMLVKDASTAYLVSHAPTPYGKTTIFRIERDDEWLNMALQILQYLQGEYISKRVSPPSELFGKLNATITQSYTDFMDLTVACITKANNTILSVSSVFNSAAGRNFLDDLPLDHHLRKEHPIQMHTGETK